MVRFCLQPRAAPNQVQHSAAYVKPDWSAFSTFRLRSFLPLLPAVSCPPTPRGAWPPALHTTCRSPNPPTLLRPSA